MPSKVPNNQIIVLGVHRSGTSVVSNLIEKMGAWYADKNEALKPQSDNPYGFWERSDVVSLNDGLLSEAGIAWYSLVNKLPIDSKTLQDKFGPKIESIIGKMDSHSSWLIKDPRLCLTWPAWDVHVRNPKFVVVVRHPLEVASSLHARDGMPIDVGLALWGFHMQALASIISGKEYLLINHNTLENDPYATSKDIFDFLQSGPDIKPLTPAIVDSIFKPNLVKQRAENIDGEVIPGTITAIWELAKSEKYNDILKIDLSDIYSAIDSELVNTWQKLYHSNVSTRELTQEFEHNKKSLQSTIDSQEQVIEENNKTISLQENKISDLKNKLHEHNEIIERLAANLQTIAESLAAFKESKTFALASFPTSIKRRILRVQNNGAIEKIEQELENAGWRIKSSSRQSTFIRVIKVFLNDPIKTLKEINISKFKTLWRLLTDKEARSNIEQALNKYERHFVVYNYKSIKPGSVSEDEIDLKPSQTPIVSIIIPVYNEYQSTLACLKSISEFTDSATPYEVIIADDNSSDQTGEIEHHVPGLVISRAENNQGFLDNCNRASKVAKGEYLLFLNNDTNVQPRWLNELLDVVVSDKTVGIVGPKFIYPDGRLQEAGGIIFQDASGWNYGRLDDPEKPEYSFVRDVDYVSGAGLLVRAEIWDKVEGFDPRFRPAYYEDTDLCFTARELGFRVVCNPFSKIMHYEGVSHGTDVSSGIKKHQEENKSVFRNKWQQVLDQEHYSGPDELFAARIHGIDKKVVLIIDHYVPMHDKDAGSRSTRKYVDLLVDEGIHVIFMGDNFYPHQPYTEELQRKGVEVLYGNYYQDHWTDWLRKNSQFIDAIYIHRPHIALNYIDVISELNPRPRTVFFGHDLHFLRCEREADISGNKDLIEDAEKWKKTELSVMRKMDFSLYPAKYESDAIKQLDPSIKVSHIPLAWYSEDEIREASTAPSKNSLLFVGGFGHPPNIDALNWFLDEVWPCVQTNIPDCQFTVIGSKCPESIKQRSSENVRVLGEVSDEILKKEYMQSRALIVPLRFGAGIKGKVLEAMSLGVPVCTTDIGAEGLPEEPAEYLQIGKDAQDLCDKITQILRNDELWVSNSRKATGVIRKHFSKESAKALLQHLHI